MYSAGLFLALFLYNLIDSLPKFAMEGTLSYSNQLYFNALYFPAHTILMISTLIYRPQLFKLASLLETSIHNPANKKRFGVIVLAMFGAIAVVTAGTAAFVEFIGIPLNSFLYGVDFEQYRGLARIMVATGGLCAAIDFCTSSSPSCELKRQLRAPTLFHLLYPSLLSG